MTYMIKATLSSFQGISYFSVAAKEIIFETLRILTCFLALVTIHGMAARGAPL